MIKVYHSVDSYEAYFRSGINESARNYQTNGKFRLVASVNNDDLNQAYQLTNHIDSNWEENEGVIALKTQNRSTSVGDILVREIDGVREVFLVAPVGFKPVV